MIANNAGGYSYPVDDAVRMHRFLIIGSEDGSYYQKERDLTRDNTKAVQRHIAAAGVEAVNHIVEVAVSRRAPKVSPSLYCLALAASAEDKDTRRAALDALPRVANTASHLQEFAGYTSTMRGWGRSLRNAVGRWYTDKEVSQVVFPVDQVPNPRRMVSPRPAPQGSPTGRERLRYLARLRMDYPVDHTTGKGIAQDDPLVHCCTSRD